VSEDIKIGYVSFQVQEFPNICPRCHHRIYPTFLFGESVPVPNSLSDGMDLMFSCPQTQCRRAFLAHYRGEEYNTYNGKRTRYTLISTIPRTPRVTEYPQEIHEVSPEFVKIITEAETAEQLRLVNVAGCGFRKALEFLVKDYCISLKPDAAPEIRSATLMAVIKNHIADENLKESAKRAAWLGNDETHYERRYSDRDINDLKALIALTSSWVTTAVRTAFFRKQMPESEKGDKGKA
jgi:hypothetical protein